MDDDVFAAPAPGRTVDRLDLGRPDDSPTASWAASPPLVRVLLAAAAILAGLAAVLTTVAVRSDPRRLTRTVVARSAAAPVNTDAAGCPAARRCTQGEPAMSALSRAVRVDFAHTAVYLAAQTQDATTHRVYRRTAVFDTDDITLVITAQCVPGGRPFAPHTYLSGESFPEFDGSTGQLSNAVQVVVPGAPGCSVAVLAHGYRISGRTLAAVERLAAQPVLQLSP